MCERHLRLKASAFKMILKPLSFTFEVDNDSQCVKFQVCENPAHRIHQKYYSKGRIPPLTERMNYARHMGISEEKIKTMFKNHMQYQKDSEKNQETLDKIFSKFNIKPTKKKILKPVKKI